MHVDEEKILEEIRQKLVITEEENMSSMNDYKGYHDIMLAFPVLKEYGLI